jgi:hypothetical protein
MGKKDGAAMSELHTYTCEICGQERQEAEGWFLVRSDGNRDRVSVLHWDSTRAREKNMHHVCSAGHARELVARWVLSGTLCCGAHGARWRVEPPAAALQRSREACEPVDIDLRSLEKAEPETLLAILDAVEIALQDKWSQLDHDDEEVLLYDA